MELAIAALCRGSRHLNLVAFDRGHSGGELFSHELQRDRPVPDTDDAVGRDKEVAAHEYAVGEEGTVAVAKHIALSKSLTQLTLHGDSTTTSDERTGPRSISARGVAAICEALHINTSVTSLTILSLTLDQNSVQHVAEVIRQHPTLVSLSLINAGLDMEHCSYLSDALKLDTLTYLDVSRNDISGAGAELLCAGLRENKSLQHMTLDNAGITPNGAKALAIVLIHHPVLTSLSLRANAIGDVGAEAISSGLHGNSTLTSLDVAMNRIGDRGCQHLCNAIKKHKALKSLVLRNNRVYNEGVLGLAELLGTGKCSLTTVNLELNFIHDEGMAALVKAASTAQSLTCLDLAGNPAEIDGGTALHELLLSRQRIAEKGAKEEVSGDAS